MSARRACSSSTNANSRFSEIWSSSSVNRRAVRSSPGSASTCRAGGDRPHLRLLVASARRAHEREASLVERDRFDEAPIFAAVGAVAELPRLALADRREVPERLCSTAPRARAVRAQRVANAISASANRRSRNAATPASSSGARAARVEEPRAARPADGGARGSRSCRGRLAARRASEQIKDADLGEMVERAQRSSASSARALGRARARRVSASSARSAARARRRARGTPPASLTASRRAGSSTSPLKWRARRAARYVIAHAGEEVRPAAERARDEAAVLEIEVGVARGDDPIQQWQRAVAPG